MKQLERRTVVLGDVVTVFDLARSVDLLAAALGSRRVRVVAGRTAGWLEEGESTTLTASRMGSDPRLTLQAVEVLSPRSADDDGLIRTEQAAGPFAEFEITTIVSPTEAATDPAYAGSPQSEVFERVQIRHPGVWPGILARELAGLVGARHRALRGAAALDVLSETSDMNGANTMNEQAGSVR